VRRSSVERRPRNDKPLAKWTSIPGRLKRSISGLSAVDLAKRGGSEGWSIAEYAHHLVEANVVASTIVLAALGSPGCVYDWSWLIPDESWMKGLGYDQTPVEPAVDLLETLCAHVSSLVRQAPGGLNRYVRLVGARGHRGTRRTVRQLLSEESAHAEKHLRDIDKTKRTLGRASSKRRTTS
jgi:hypothetical protein